jgi:hypothetical protein
MPSWSEIAAAQGGLATRAQLSGCGVNRWSVSHRIESARWARVSATVIATFTGELSWEQRLWAAVLHGGEGAALSELTAATLHGLRNWERDQICVLVPYECGRPTPMDGVRFARSRRPFSTWMSARLDLPALRLEAALLLFAARERNPRAAEGALAAAVQQGRTTADRLMVWLDRLQPLRRSSALRMALTDIAGGAHSTAELDVNRMCRTFGLAPPQRQVKRRDAHGRTRFTDCEWDLPDGRTLVLEVDGAFHMDVEHWEDDIQRQRALISPARLTVHCTSRELRDCP